MEDATGRTIVVSRTTAEDNIISQLKWYHKSNVNYERQCNDVARLVTLVGGSIDWRYLDETA